MESCIFCKIVKGEIPCHKIYEDTEFLAFLDIAPINKGHTLIIPKTHYETIIDIPEALLKEMSKIVKKISESLTKIGAEGIMINQNNKKASEQLVMHMHFHVIPRYLNDGYKYNWPKRKYNSGEAEELVKKIRDEL